MQKTSRLDSHVITVDGSEPVAPTLGLEVAAYSKKVIGWFNCTICSPLGAKAKPDDVTETTGSEASAYGEATPNSAQNWVWVNYGQWKEYLPVKQLVVLNGGEELSLIHI